MGAYTRTTFTSGVSTITAAYLNGVETFIDTMDDANINAAGGGRLNVLTLGFTTGTITRMSRFSGTGSVTAAAHGLGGTPDIILFNYAGNFGSPPDHPIYYYNEGSSTVHVVADSTYFWYGLAIKF
jgi:hypothetical protein